MVRARAISNACTSLKPLQVHEMQAIHTPEMIEENLTLKSCQTYKKNHECWEWKCHQVILTHV